jgi:IS5 family transposase
MRFLGLSINDPVPDAKTIWLFRDKLTTDNMIEQLFDHLDKLLDKDGIIVHKGKLVDASIVEVPIQRKIAGRRIKNLKKAMCLKSGKKINPTRKIQMPSG